MPTRPAPNAPSAHSGIGPSPLFPVTIGFADKISEKLNPVVPPIRTLFTRAFDDSCRLRMAAFRRSSSEDVLEETLDEIQDGFREKAGQECRKTYHLGLPQELFWILREAT